MYGDDFITENTVSQIVYSKARDVSVLHRALPGLCLSKGCIQGCVHGYQNYQNKSLIQEYEPIVNIKAFDAPVLEFTDAEWPEWSQWQKPRSNWSERSRSIDSIGSTDTSDTAFSSVSQSLYSETESEAETLNESSFNVSGNSGLLNSNLSSLFNLARYNIKPASAKPLAQKPAVHTKSVKSVRKSSDSTTSISPSKQGSYSTNNCLHPAKSGHTLWVGNLPHNAELEDLCNLFGTPKLQSIYLIQRTGCAFVNYIDAKGLKEGFEIVERRGSKIRENSIVVREQQPQNVESTEIAQPTSAKGAKNRYFICKSLTVADLEEAQHTNMWSTQIRNLSKFNEAYETSQNTYLVFSVNRMSCFYGVARLESTFEEAQELNAAAKDDRSQMALVTPTESFLHKKDGVLVPAGQTVFDPLRGSQFWMAHDCPVEEPQVEKFTSPAKIRWITVPNSSVPFSKTKSMKNILNQNKPLKVARDGTEIDPAIAKTLCELFEQN